MSLTIKTGDPRNPAVIELLDQSHALMNRLFPTDGCHYLKLNELCVPEITFLIVYDGQQIIGCGALLNRTTYGEVKSMFVDPASRGKGAGDLLVKKLVNCARDANLPLLRLETGDKLAAAIKLYEKHNFIRRGPFGPYTSHPDSTFMERPL
ncbi:MAG: GNAT family N-acetyltransferase [Amylibacter sp.]|nr:GNAT family N-acetyltransferase [Amylibacter sp.]